MSEWIHDPMTAGERVAARAFVRAVFGTPTETIQMGDASPPKPFGEAVADSWRGIKDWYNGPETSQKTDPSVREHVNAEVDRQIKASEKQKPFPGILP